MRDLTGSLRRGILHSYKRKYMEDKNMFDKLEDLVARLDELQNEL